MVLQIQRETSLKASSPDQPGKKFFPASDYFCIFNIYNDKLSREEEVLYTWYPRWSRYVNCKGGVAVVYNIKLIGNTCELKERDNFHLFVNYLFFSFHDISCLIAHVKLMEVE
jgi:hypothetical protein